MKRIELVQDEAYDRVIIFIYNEYSKVVGLNFYQGVDDLDTDYMKNDEHLFGIFKRINEDTDYGQDLIVVANEAIEEHMIIKNEDVREMLIEEIVKKAINDLTSEVLYKTKVSGAYLEKSEVEMIDTTKEALNKIYTVIIEKRYKYGK